MDLSSATLWVSKIVGHDLFNEVMVLLLFAALAGLAALKLKQPLIIAFIVVGVLAGPSGLGIVQATDAGIRLFASLGLSLLLFAVGLRLDLGHIRSSGTVALVAGLAQVAATVGLGYPLCLAIGLGAVPALYISVSLAFSSTIIIVKLLSDKRETEALHGRIAVGILIVQDIIAIVAMIALGTIGGKGGTGLWSQMGLVVVKMVGFVAVLALFASYVMPRLSETLARSAELLTLFAIAWAVIVAAVGEMLGLSREVGAFLAGVSLASTQYREIIGARLVSLRDFLLLFFFIDLGMGLNLGSLGKQVWAAVPISIFVLLGKPLMVAVMLGVMGYRRRTSVLTGLSMGQVSEFSLILVNLGGRAGHIGPDAVALVTLAGVVTIGLSSYMMVNSQGIYTRLRPYLGFLERRAPHREESMDSPEHTAPEVILFGLGRYGSGIARRLEERGLRLLGVDFDPQAVEAWKRRGGSAWFGDAEDYEFPSMLPLSSARWVVCAIPEYEANLSLLRTLASHRYRGSVAVTASHRRYIEALRQAGADLVLAPLADAAVQAVDELEAADERQRRVKMDKQIAEMSGHYVVCGYGRMGQQIARDFRLHGTPFVVVESNPVQMKRLRDAGVLYVEGKATDDRTLTAAGVQRARGLVSVNPTDEENVFIVLTARGLNPDLFIIARSIMLENEDKLRRAGANKVFSPYIIGGHRMAGAAIRPRAVEFLDLPIDSRHLDIEIAELHVGDSSPVMNRTIADCRLNETPGVLIVAVRRPSGEVEDGSSPSLLLGEGDVILVVGTSARIDEIQRDIEGE